MTQYVRNAWYMAGWAPDFPETGLNSLMIFGEPIVLYRSKDGIWTALEDVCCHRLAPLSKGRQEGDDIRCMYHGLKFSPEGRCIEIPGQTSISSKVRVRSYPVEQKWGAVWIWMGDVEKVDKALIPELPAPDSKELTVKWDSADVAGNAELIWNNLLDLSHVIYVHLPSFMDNDEKMQQIALDSETVDKDITQLERGVRIKRWQFDKHRHPIFGNKVTDECVLSEFLVPGTLLLQLISYEPGVRDRYSDVDVDKIPENDRLSVRYSCQVVTPIDERRTRIFFSSGLKNEYAEYLPPLFETIQTALAEDEVIVNAQQKMIDNLPDRDVINLAMDAPIVRYQTVMKELLESDT